MSEHVISTMYRLMNKCLDVETLRDILNDLIDEGYSKAQVCYRIGRTADGMALAFPLAWFRADEGKTMLAFSPCVPPDANVDGTEFDTIVDVKDNSLNISFIEYNDNKGE